MQCTYSGNEFKFYNVKNSLLPFESSTYFYLFIVSVNFVILFISIECIAFIFSGRSLIK